MREEAATQRQHWHCPDKRRLTVAVATERDRWGCESMGFGGGLGSLNVSGGQGGVAEVLEGMRMRALVNVLDLLFSMNGSIFCTLRLSH